MKAATPPASATAAIGDELKRAHHGDRPSPYLILFTLWLLVFTASSQIMIIAPILPRIGEQLGIQESLLGTLVTANVAMVGLFALLVGPVSDKIGRRRILLLGTVLLAIALALHAFALGYGSLLAVRALAGAAGGVLSGASVAYVGDYFPYERRGWANGWIMSGMAFGQIIGIPAGTLLAAEYGFRTPFLAFAVLAAGTAILIWRVLPQPAVTLLVGRLTLRRGVGNYADLLRRPEILAAGIIFAGMFGANSLFIVFLPTWLETEIGATPEQIASLFFIGGIANVMVGPQAGKLSDRIGRKGVIIASSLGLVAVMATTTLVISGVWIAYLFFFATMALFAARIGPFQALLTAIVSGDRRGTLMSLTMGLGNLGFGLGSAIAGPAYARFGYGSNTLIAAVGMLLMVAMIWRFLPEPPRGVSARRANTDRASTERRSPARLAAAGRDG